MRDLFQRLRPPVFIPVFVIVCGLVFAAIDAFPRRNEMERSDWNVSVILDAMEQHRQGEGPLRVACLPWRIYFNMEVLHLGAAARGLSLVRVYVPGEDGSVDFVRVAEAEFVVTSPRSREFDEELPWQRELRLALERDDKRLGGEYVSVEIFVMPDGSLVTLWRAAR